MRRKTTALLFVFSMLFFASIGYYWVRAMSWSALPTESQSSIDHRFEGYRDQFNQLPTRPAPDVLAFFDLKDDELEDYIDRIRNLAQEQKSQELVAACRQQPQQMNQTIERIVKWHRSGASWPRCSEGIGQVWLLHLIAALFECSPQDKQD